jgi:integrase
LARGQSWDAEEARRFLESAYSDRDPPYPLWVLILVLGLRKGEAQGLIWSAIDLDGGQVSLE